MSAKLRQQRGFTLVELMIVVAIVGILAALAIYGVKKYLANAKSAEARNSIGQMAKDAVTAYSKEGMAPTVLAPGTSTGVTNRLCSSAANPVPKTKAGIAAKKYQSQPSDWSEAATADQFTGWNCVKFSMSDPQYYMYNYTSNATAAGAAGETFTCTANGDLDGDGNMSTFSMVGTIQADTKKTGVLTAVLAPNILEVSPDE